MGSASRDGYQRSESVEVPLLVGGASAGAPSGKQSGIAEARSRNSQPQPVQAASRAPAAKQAPMTKAAAPKRAPKCDSVLCTRVGVCLCNDQPPPMLLTPS